jgi:hypothetical protein
LSKIIIVIIMSANSFIVSQSQEDELPTVSNPNEVSVVDSASNSDKSNQNHPTSSFLVRMVRCIKMTLSMILVLFSAVMVSVAIVTNQTAATVKYGIHPIVALVEFWLSLAWLAMLEGGLNAIVGLQPIPKSLYQHTHRKTYLCTTAAFRGDNIDRFIVGRQYLDLSIVFSTSLLVSAVKGANVLGLPQIVNDIFLRSGFGVILCTIVFGQLIAVINSAHNMLDFINNWCMVVSAYLALLVEWSGILHAVYLVQILFAMLVDRSKKAADLNNKKNEKNNLDILAEKPSDMTEKRSESTLPMGDRSSTSPSSNSEESSVDDDDVMPAPTSNKPFWRRFMFWIRVVFSVSMCIFSLVVISVALVQGDTKIRSNIPVPVSFLSLITLYLLSGFMEALLIAFFAVKHIDKAKFEANPTARRNCEFFFSGSQGMKDNNHELNNKKFQAFLAGRQTTQTVIMFMIARIININMKEEGETLFGVPSLVQAILFKSGLLNALVSTILASLMWRVTANYFPMFYLGSPISIWIMRFGLLVDGTGLCDSAWILAKIPAVIVGYKPDEYYIAKATSTMQQQSQQKEETGEVTTMVNNTMGYHKQSTSAMESLDSSSSCGGSCHDASVKEQDQQC